MRFLMVDHISSWTPNSGIHGVKNVAMSEDFLEHHFPRRPIMPGSLLLEALNQLAAWLEAAESDFESWLVVDEVTRCGYYGFVLPGDQVDLVVEPLGPTSDGRRRYRGVGTVAGASRIKADFSGRITLLADVADPDAQRRLFASLTREKTW